MSGLVTTVLASLVLACQRRLDDGELLELHVLHDAAESCTRYCCKVWSPR